jgi:hypothetical protein
MQRTLVWFVSIWSNARVLRKEAETKLKIMMFYKDNVKGSLYDKLKESSFHQSYYEKKYMWSYFVINEVFNFYLCVNSWMFVDNAH